MNWHAFVVGMATWAVLWGTEPASRAADPMTFGEISLRVRMGEAAQIIVQDTARRKLAEPLTGEQEAALQKAGLSADAIAALRSPALLADPETVAAFNQRKGLVTPPPVETAPAPEAASTPAPPAPSEAFNQRSSDLIKVGDLAPDFETHAVGGRPVSLGQLKGRVALVVIFATWSEPSVRELKAVEKFVWSRFGGEGLAIIALGSGDTVDKLIEFKKQNELTFDLAEDPGKKINALYATDLVPRCYVVARDGLVKFTSAGLNKNDFLRMLNIIGSEMKR